MVKCKYSVGNVISLCNDVVSKLKQNTAKYLVETHHMFVIVDSDNVGGYLISPISSQIKNLIPKYPENVEILQWKNCGLHKRSYCETNFEMIVLDEWVYKVVTTLDESDITRIQQQKLITPPIIMENYQL